MILTPQYLMTCKSNEQEDIDEPTEKILLNEINTVEEFTPEDNIPDFVVVSNKEEFYFRCHDEEEVEG